MSGSSITTRRILSDAMKSLMLEKPFSSISVKNICEHCGINRKSFYYHYHDKFDLVNNIYNEEFLNSALNRQYTSVWEFIDDLSEYFYLNRKFYRNAFNVQGQNSFKECFCDSLYPMLRKFTEQIGMGEPELKRMTKYFCVMFSAAVEYWLNDKEPDSAKDFSYSVHCLFNAACDRSLRLKDYSSSRIAFMSNFYN